MTECKGMFDVNFRYKKSRIKRDFSDNWLN